MGAKLTSLAIVLALLSACDPNPASAPEVDAVRHSPEHPILIEFTRDYCLPCLIMAPDIAALRQQHAAAVDVVEVNLDREKNEAIGLFFVVETVPSQVFVDSSGRIVARHAGVASRDELGDTLTRLGWVR